MLGLDRYGMDIPNPAVEFHARRFAVVTLNELSIGAPSKHPHIVKILYKARISNGSKQKQIMVLNVGITPSVAMIFAIHSDESF